MNNKLKRQDIVYPELSYKIIGILFDAFNKLGYQYQEKYYQRAISESFKNSGINFRQQVYNPVQFNGTNIGHYFFDFLVDDKIVLEIKRGDRFARNDITQTLAYLKSANLQLGILARFSSRGLKYKRIINFSSDSYIRKNS